LKRSIDPGSIFHPYISTIEVPSFHLGQDRLQTYIHEHSSRFGGAPMFDRSSWRNMTVGLGLTAMVVGTAFAVAFW
jgi:hypothetical protein